MPPPPTSFRLSQFVSGTELPCTVSVTGGYSHGAADEEESISNGEVITLHSVQDVQVIQAQDHLDRSVTLPVTNSENKFIVLPSEPLLDGKIYDTLHDMIKDPNMPSKVRVMAAVDSGDEENTIYVDDILEMVTLSGNSQSADGDQRCLILKNQLGEKLKLPLSTPGKFSTQLDTKWYSMVEVLDKWELPRRVQQVNTNPARSQIALHNKFLLTAKEVETSVLATVNKELIYLPQHAEIEVCLLNSPPPTPQVPTIHLEELAEDARLPAPPDQEAGKEEDQPSTDASTNTDQRRQSSVFDDNTAGLGFTLTESEKERVRVGTIRRFGSSSKIHQEAGELEEETKPHRAMELFEQLQEKTAECIRLQEWCNKWQAKCQRLDSQTQNLQKSADDTERKAMFWRQQTHQKQGIDEGTLQKLEEYRKTGNKDLLRFEERNASVTLLNGKPARATKGPAQKEEISIATLTINNMQVVLKTLHMEEYCQLFLDEQVDGGLLLDLPEESLKSDLGMDSLLHRKKLLRALHGKSPVRLQELLST